MVRIPILPRDPRFTKPAIERRIFEALAPLVGWQVVPGSIQQPTPPQPDILCDVVGVGPLAVELVSLDDPATRRRLQNMFNTNHAWACALNVWSPMQRRFLLAHLADAFITLQFHNEADVQARARALYALQQLLFSNPSRQGRIGPAEIGNPHGFECAHIHRGSVTNGPHLSPQSGGFWHPPRVANIGKHLQTRYQCNRPLELFAYSTHDEPDASTTSLASIAATVAQYLPGSQFQRVHLFHVGFRQRIQSWP